MGYLERCANGRCVHISDGEGLMLTSGYRPEAVVQEFFLRHYDDGIWMCFVDLAQRGRLTDSQTVISFSSNVEGWNNSSIVTTRLTSP